MREEWREGRKEVTTTHTSTRVPHPLRVHHQRTYFFSLSSTVSFTTPATIDTHAFSARMQSFEVRHMDGKGRQGVSVSLRCGTDDKVGRDSRVVCGLPMLQGCPSLCYTAKGQQASPSFLDAEATAWVPVSLRLGLDSKGPVCNRLIRWSTLSPSFMRAEMSSCGPASGHSSKLLASNNVIWDIFAAQTHKSMPWYAIRGRNRSPLKVALQVPRCGRKRLSLCALRAGTAASQSLQICGHTCA